MKNKLYFFFSALIIINMLLFGCGGGDNSGQSVGNTVFLQASTKSNTSTAAFAQFTSASSLQLEEQLEFSVKSVVLPNSGSLASDVNIVSEDISFEYVGSTDPTYTEKIILPSYRIYSSGIITPGGTLDLKFPVIMAATKFYLKSNYPSSPFINLSSNKLNFKVNVTFNGIELKSGKSLSVTTNANLFITQ